MCVIHYNQHTGDAEKKDYLLHMYLVGRKRINKCYMKLFSMILNAILLRFLVIYEKNIGWKFGSMWCATPPWWWQHCKKTSRMVFSQKNTSHRKIQTSKTVCVVCNTYDEKKRSCILLSGVWCCSEHPSMCVSRSSIQWNIIGIMYDAHLLSTVYRKLLFHVTSM